MAIRSADADARPSVHVPPAGDDQPSWRKVGAIAAVGFVVGVAWPRVAGIRLGPGLPDTAASSSPDALPPAPAAASGARSAPTVPPRAESTEASLPATAAVTVSSDAAPSPATGDSTDELVVGHGSVASCETSSGEVLKAAQCGGLAGLDALVMPRLRRLAKCKAGPLPPRLRYDVTVDFVRGTLAIDPTRPRTSPDSLLACARSEMSGLNVATLGHEHPRYTVTYSVGPDARRSSSPGTESPAVPPSPAPAVEGAAQVEWEVALVRDTPKVGKVVARLQRGATVRVGAPKDGWYPVRYGDDFSGAGWVYRAALGR